MSTIVREELIATLPAPRWELEARVAVSGLSDNEKAIVLADYAVIELDKNGRGVTVRYIGTADECADILVEARGDGHKVTMLPIDSDW